MDLRGLVEGDCGGANPLMQLGGTFTRDAAYTEEGFRQQQNVSENMVNEFLGQIAGPPQTFRMDNLLDEMREIEQHNCPPRVINAPKVIQEVVTNNSNWVTDFHSSNVAQPVNRPHLTAASYPRSNEIGRVGALPMSQQYYNRPMGLPLYNSGNMINVQPVQNNITYAEEFFDDNQTEKQKTVESFFEKVNEEKQREVENIENITDEWFEEFQKNKKEEADKSENYYEKFWSKLQKDWNDLAEYDNHSWLTTDADYDPHKSYEFQEHNPMIDDVNAFEKGKEFLTQGDIPSAVICFEAAVQQTNSENPEAWELLGLSQAENEMDPRAIAALKRSLELKPDNLRALMALSVSYTNESLQSQALKMLGQWLHYHPKYSNMLPDHLRPMNDKESAGMTTSSVIGSSALKEMQSLFISIVQKYSQPIDPDIQEALGVLFNLSSEYDKAVDCFQTSLLVNSNNSKTWNRLGASLANGNRSVEAVEAYKRALEIQPGFIRARYNVGIICMNLKSYNEAAEHLLTALNMQATSPNRSGIAATNNLASINSSNQMSEVIWSTLRMVFALMGREDLKNSANNRDLESLNRELKLN